MTARIVIGFLLGLCFLGVLYIAYILPRFQNEPFTKSAVGHILLPDLTVPNATNYTNGEHRNRTRDRVNNVAFLKVPKAGSTTMQNLLFRFGMRHNLNILLPKHGNFVPNINSVIPLKPPKTYNVLACHAHYSKALFAKLIPTGSVQIAIVREPIEKMISAAYYSRDVWHKKYLVNIPRADFIHNLINYPEIYDTSFYSSTHNSMGKFFGFPKTIKSTNKDKIDSYLDRLNSEFDLVIILEKFDESLVMMKRYLSWSFLDIIYSKTNSHKHEPVVLNKHEQMKVRETNFLDFAIYEYFTQVFDKRLQSMSDDFAEEVHYFKQLHNKVRVFCSQTNLQDDSKLVVDQSTWEKEFTVLGVECRWMATNEAKFIKMIKKEINKSKASNN